MFWSSFAAQSRINDLLDQPDLEIEQLLDDDDILQKCRERDQRLIDFLCREENVDFMLSQVCEPPCSDEFDTSLYRYPSLICEIMTCDIAPLLDLIVGEPSASISRPTEDAWNGSSMVVDEPNVSGSQGVAPQADSSSSSDMSFASPTAATAPVASADTASPDPTSDQHAPSTAAAAAAAAKPGNQETAAGDQVVTRPRLDRLLRAIKADSILNPLTASFISRILVHLAMLRSKIVIPYMRKYPNLLENVLAHLDLTAMADLLIQLAQQGCGLRHLLFLWFIEDNLVPRLIDCFVPTNSWEVHESAAHCLIQLISILRTYLVDNSLCGPNSDVNADDSDTGLPANNPYAVLMKEDQAGYANATRLLDILESEETMSALLARLTDHDQVTTSIVVNCIEVFVAVLDKRRPETGFALPDGGPGGAVMELEMLLGNNVSGSSGPMRSGPGQSSPTSGSVGGDARVSGGGGGSNSPGATSQANNRAESIDKIRVVCASANLARACCPRLSHLHALLQRAHEQTYNRMPTTSGVLDPPLGRCRLSIAQFFALLAMLPLETGIQVAMVKEGVIKTLMNLFEQYPLNTLLHQAVRDFLIALFTHAGVIRKRSVASASATAGGGGDKMQAASNDSTDSPPAPSSTSNAVSTKPSDSQQQMELDADATAAQSNTDNEPASTILDEAFAAIVCDHLLIDWCLRLSPLPTGRSGTEHATGTSAVRLSKLHPKPGYSGHLWQLANTIQEARNGPRGDFVNRLLQSLDPTSLKSWDDFVEGDLAEINSQQIADTPTVTKSDQEDVLIQFLSHQDLGSWLSQSSGFFGGLNSGKFSLFLAPLNSQQQQQQHDTKNKTGSGDQFVLKLSTRMDDDDDGDDPGADVDDETRGTDADSTDPVLQRTVRRGKPDPDSLSSPQLLPSSMWVDSTDANNKASLITGGSPPPISVDVTAEQPLAARLASHGLGTGFTRARTRNASSDDSDPELDPDLLDQAGAGRCAGNGIRGVLGAASSLHDEDEDDHDEDDDDDEEEDLKSPVVIKQQRSTTSQSASVIQIPRVVAAARTDFHGVPLVNTASGTSASAAFVASSKPELLDTADPWGSSSSFQAATCCTEEGWANFDDDNPTDTAVPACKSTVAKTSPDSAWPTTSSDEPAAEKSNSPSINGVPKSSDKPSPGSLSVHASPTSLISSPANSLSKPAGS